MYTLVFMKMKDVPEALKPRLRDLSFGPENGTMWRWTFQSGECYAAILTHRGATSEKVAAWACLTHEDDRFPVVGCYVDKNQRRKGLGTVVANYLLEMAKLEPRSAVYAVSHNWAAWPALLQSFGLEHFEWV